MIKAIRHFSVVPRIMPLTHASFCNFAGTITGQKQNFVRRQVLKRCLSRSYSYDHKINDDTKNFRKKPFRTVFWTTASLGGLYFLSQYPYLVGNTTQDDGSFSSRLQRLFPPEFEIGNLISAPTLAITKLCGYAFEIEHPKFIAKWLVAAYSKLFDLDLQHAERENINDYKSIQDLFTRTLKPSSLLIGQSKIVSPCDGWIVNVGQIDFTTNSTLLEYVKGQSVDYQSFFGDFMNELNPMDSKTDKCRKNLYYAIFYLSPKCYHWFHSPTSFKLNSIKHITGSTLPVATKFIKISPNSVCRNHRVILHGTWHDGREFSMALIGAMNVGKIALQFTDINKTYIPTSPLTPYVIDSKVLDRERDLEKGLRLGKFMMGSSVVILFEAPPDSQSFCVKPGEFVRVGDNLVL